MIEGAGVDRSKRCCRSRFRSSVRRSWREDSVRPLGATGFTTSFVAGSATNSATGLTEGFATGAGAGFAAASV